MSSLKTFGAMVALTCSFGLWQAPSAGAIPDFNFYTYGGCPATVQNRIDPINVMFFNWGTWDRTTNETHAHSSYFQHGSSWPGWVGQAFKDHQVCYPADSGGTITHMATSEWWTSRFHFREHPVPFDNTWGWTTIADSHYEVVTTCSWWFRPSHAVPYGGYNDAREFLAGQFNPLYTPNHGRAWGYYGNTDPRPQCTGDAPRSDGWLVAISMHQSYH